MAERHYELLGPDREAQLEDMRVRLAELGDVVGAQALEAMLAEWAQVGGAGLDPATAFVDEIAKWLKAAMVDLGLPADRVATACVGSTLDENVSAHTRAFADGSSLVQVSDAVLALANVYAAHCGANFQAFASVGPVRRMWRSLKAARTGRLGGDPAELTGLLRYHNVNQRLYGLAAKVTLRSEEATGDLSSAVAAMAANFVVGHELAHHVLGHEPPDEHLPVCSAEHRLEFEADELAHRASLRSWQLQLAQAPADVRAQAGGFEVFATLGAAIAMLAVECAEQGLFIRRGCTHPPARRRTEVLLGTLDPGLRQFAEMFLRDLITATEAATVFDDSVPPFDWARFAANDRLETPHPPAYLRAIAQYDALQCLPVAGASRVLRERFPAIAAVARDDAATALSTWDIPAEKIPLLLDKDHPLTFHTLVTYLRKAFTEVPAGQRLAAAVLAATVVAPALA